MARIVDSQLSTQKEVWGETDLSLNPEIKGHCLGGQLLLCVLTDCRRLVLTVHSRKVFPSEF